jgi:hypothetical protein
MPKPRMIVLAVLFSSATAGRNTMVKPTWNGITSLAVWSGRARAKFFGTSSPMIIDSSVATNTEMIVAVVGIATSGRPTAVSAGVRKMLKAGSRV